MAIPARMPGTITLLNFTFVLGMKIYRAMNISDISTYGVKSISVRTAEPNIRKSGILSATVAKKMLIPDEMTIRMGKTKNMAR